MDLPQFSCEDRAADLERYAPANTERRLVGIEAIALIGFAEVVAAPIYDDARVSPSPILRGSTLAWTCSRVGRGHRDIIEILILLCPRRLAWWGQHHGDSPLRPASSTGSCCRLGRSWRASSSRAPSLSETEQALDRGTPFIHLLGCEQKLQQQLSSRHGLRSFPSHRC